MIEKDIAYLEYQISKTAPRNLLLIAAAAVAIVVVGAINLRLSYMYASGGGYPFRDVLAGWFGGVSVSKTYPGVYIKALERFETGLTEIAISVLVVLQVVRWHFNRKRYSRILAYLAERSG